jgi:hypothetical protein
LADPVIRVLLISRAPIDTGLGQQLRKIPRKFLGREVGMSIKEMIR